MFGTAVLPAGEREDVLAAARCNGGSRRRGITSRKATSGWERWFPERCVPVSPVLDMKMTLISRDISTAYLCWMVSQQCSSEGSQPSYLPALSELLSTPKPYPLSCSPPIHQHEGVALWAAIVLLPTLTGASVFYNSWLAKPYTKEACACYKASQHQQSHCVSLPAVVTS